MPNDAYHAANGLVVVNPAPKGLLPGQYKPVTGESDAMRFGTLVHTAVWSRICSTPTSPRTPPRGVEG